MMDSHSEVVKEVRTMKVVTILLLCIALLGTHDFSATTKTSPANTPAAPEPIALVTQISGVVKIKSGAGKSKSTDLTTFLYEDDELSVDDSSYALLLQVNAFSQQLTGKKKRTIKPLSPPPPQGAMTQEQFNWYKRQYAKALENREVKPPQAKRKKKRITALTLRFGIMVDPRPVLAWTRVSGVQNYLVRLFDKDDKVIWSQNMTDQQVVVAPAIPSGEYKWDVTATWMAKHEFVHDFTPFIVAAPEEADKIKNELQQAKGINPNPDDINLIYVAACLEYKQYREAEEELRKGLRRSTSDKVLWTLLAETYRAMKRWDDRETARKFSSNPKPTQELKAFIAERDLSGAVK
jgi:hypothetical protein